MQPTSSTDEFHKFLSWGANLDEFPADAWDKVLISHNFLSLFRHQHDAGD